MLLTKHSEDAGEEFVNFFSPNAVNLKLTNLRLSLQICATGDSGFSLVSSATDEQLKINDDATNVQVLSVLSYCFVLSLNIPRNFDLFWDKEDND